MTLLLVAGVVIAGAIAGALGSLLGIGGGVFLVPFLNAGLGVDFEIARAVSLMTVIATSSAVSAGTAGKNLINLRLGMLLEVASAAGGLAAAMTLQYLTVHQLYVIFSVVTAAIAMIMLSRLDRRNVLDKSVDPGVLGGRFIDETGHEISYRVKRLPVAMAASFVAGNISSFLGIGGGILKVPALNSWCGVPMRAAAATSALMIGVTAVSSAPVYYSRGMIQPPLAAAAVLGVLVGSRAGLRFAGRARAKWLKVLMATVLLIVSSLYLYKSL
ncbi:MAG TPA: sulfite exporter TauE/SafE family protein [Vicinamibacterales bacterium]